MNGKDKNYLLARYACTIKKVAIFTGFFHTVCVNSCPALNIVICDPWNSPGAATAHVTFGWPPPSAPPKLNITAPPPPEEYDIEPGCEEANPSEDNPDATVVDDTELTRSEKTANAQFSVQVDHADVNLFISGPYWNPLVFYSFVIFICTCTYIYFG